MKMTKWLMILLCLFPLCMIDSAFGFVVEPSIIRLSNIELGKFIDMDGFVLVQIVNSSNKDSKYVVEIIACREYGCKPRSGYEDIPDSKWITVKNQEVAVPAQQTGYIKDVFIKVPKNKEYVGKKYQAVVKVTSKANAGQLMNLEVAIPLWIEIASRDKK